MLVSKYQSIAAGGTCSKPATPYRLQNANWPLGGPKMADGVWKDIQPEVIRPSNQVLRNKFFDPSFSSMRKGRDREWKKS